MGRFAIYQEFIVLDMDSLVSVLSRSAPPFLPPPLHACSLVETHTLQNNDVQEGVTS